MNFYIIYTVKQVNMKPVYNEICFCVQRPLFVANNKSQ